MVFNILNTTNYGMMQNQMAAGLWNAAAQNCSFWSVMTPSCFPTIMLDPRFLLQRKSIFPAFGNQSNNQSWQNWIIPSNNQTQGGNPWDGYWEAWNKNNKKVETDDSEDVAKEGTVTKETRVENLTTLLKEIQKETDVADEAIKTALEEAEKAPTPKEKLNALNKVFDNVSIKFDDIKNCLDQKDKDLLVQAGLASNKSEEEIDKQIEEIEKKVKEISDSKFSTGNLTGLVSENQIDIFDLVAKYPDIITAINAQKAKITDPEDQVPCNNTIKLICDNLITRAKEINAKGLEAEIKALSDAINNNKYDKIQEVFDKLYVAARLKAEENVITHLKEKYGENIVDNTTFNVEENLNENYSAAIKAYQAKQIETKEEVNNNGKAEHKGTSTSQKNGKETSKAANNPKVYLEPGNGAWYGNEVANLLIGCTNDDEEKRVSDYIQYRVNENNIFHFLGGYNSNICGGDYIFTQLATEYGFNEGTQHPNNLKCMKHLLSKVVSYLKNNEDTLKTCYKSYSEDYKFLSKKLNELQDDNYQVDKRDAIAIDSIINKYSGTERNRTIYVKK